MTRGRSRFLLLFIMLGVTLTFWCAQAIEPPAAQADWVGWQENFSSAIGACNSFAEMRERPLLGVEPWSIDANGTILSFKCIIKSILECCVYWDPTTANCAAGTSINGYTENGCNKTPARKSLGQCSIRQEGGGEANSSPGQTKQCEVGPVPGDTGNRTTGNPITLAAGNKFEQATDFATAGPDSLAFIRYYNSFEHAETDLGIGWRSNFDRRLRFITGTEIVVDGGMSARCD